MKTTRIASAAALALLVAAGAQAEGHYVPGVEGMQGPSVPPPGVYYLGYLVNYDISSLRAPGSSDAIPGRNKGSVTALANRLVWVTNHKFLGADYGIETIIPVMRTSLDFANSKDSGVGDVYVGPLVLGWHGPQWDAVAAAGMWLDTASTREPASPGKGFKSTMLTGGLTYYFDGAKTITGSALARYEFNSRKDNGIRPGQQLTVEWGLGKSFGTFSAGLVGYSQWQTTNDNGVGASDDKSSVHAVGAEVVYPIPSAGVFLKAAAYKEVSAKGGTNPQPKGSLVRFSLVKAF
ncbi:MAG: transporter [Comamonas sp.]|jgi:hypothetical protein|nr:transporter [Comamonas sp.]